MSVKIQKDTYLRASEYKQVTIDMFRQIYMIKDITHAKDNKQPKQFNILQQE